MYLVIGKPASIEEVVKFKSSTQELKAREKILLIDDRPFTKFQSLINNGFKLTKLDDVRSIEQVEPYAVIACDVEGVGSNFGSEFQGAHVISEIRKSYPDKYLIAFTAASHTALYSEMLKSADLRTAKDADINSWIGYLETALQTIGDPRLRWFRMRSFLLSFGYDTFTVLKLEQAYIKSVTNRDASHLRSEKLLKSLPDGLAPIIIKFTATAVVEIIKAIH